MKRTKKSIKKTKKNTNSNIPAEFCWDYLSPLQVEVFGNFDKAARMFRTLVQADGVLAEFKRHSSYEKPSEKKRRKHAETMQRLHEEEVKQAKILSGEYEREKIKKEEKKAKRRAEREEKRAKQNVEQR